ncbi:excinuclease ABC subunit UvrC [Microbacter margulisiae]|uniref:UvrABC system protein C n=1 Tax=Microbacter margulisiae TaxID=1350067 RepID=A0A7W5DTC0_9PORP|nr:excinuclease ABC subunit UvrC [Microbacter margulisiae]MBB3188692.1 excinuclease ABC subunit C [Microbacter margulisiae]
MPQPKIDISTLPEEPGVYQYFNQEGEIIYVGKAKNLKKRVSSYFSKQHENRKLVALARQIASLKYIVVESEEDALLLENNLIKQHHPRYNILLKDDKTYPWLCITNERFPRVFKTRKIINDGSKYFGPFSSVSTLTTLLNTLHEIYPIRTCKLRLTPENIEKKAFRVCLQYHIHRCLGPCVGLQNEEDYNRMIAEIEQITKGDIQAVSKYMLQEMQQLAGQLQFEAAQKIKEKYELLERYKAKSIVTTLTEHEFDVFSYDENEDSAYINVLHIANGAIVQGVTVEYKKRLDEPKEEILGLAIVELRERLKSNAREIIVPFAPDLHEEKLTLTIPTRGDKKKLLALSIQNTETYKAEKQKQAEKLNPDQRVIRILSSLQKDLNMKELPIHIECFDNSNIQGTNPVASCVVFQRAKPAKKEYRHFNIKTVEGPNDYASMEEVVFRRYHRLKEEGTPLPQLVVIDGGKGQLGMAMGALRQLELDNQITVIGIAKRLEEIYFPEDPIPLYLDKNSESLKLIQQIRDEAHRFGITHHRLKRSKTQVTSELDSIHGIGEKSKQALLQHFKSVKRLRSATKEEIAEIVGNERASRIYNHFNPDLTR